MKINLENRILKNGWALLYLSIFSILSVGCKTYGQIEKSNEITIQNIKSKETKSFIEKSLIGYWEFNKLTSPSGKAIDMRETHLDTLKIIEDISRPSIIFQESRRYELLKKGAVVEKGEWSYDEKDRIIRYVFDKPKYNIPIDKISPELLKKLKEEGSLIEFTENSWEIQEITDEELSIIEHLPHDEFNLKYNLRIYTKEN